MRIEELKPNAIVRGSLFSEPVQIIAIVPLGKSVKLIGTGLKTGLTHQPILSVEQLATLEVSSDQKSYDGEYNAGGVRPGPATGSEGRGTRRALICRCCHPSGTAGAILSPSYRRRR